jgi:hypothetical protein
VSGAGCSEIALACWTSEGELVEVVVHASSDPAIFSTYSPSVSVDPWVVYVSWLEGRDKIREEHTVFGCDTVRPCAPLSDLGPNPG